MQYLKRYECKISYIKPSNHKRRKKLYYQQLHCWWLNENIWWNSKTKHILQPHHRAKSALCWLFQQEGGETNSEAWRIIQIKLKDEIQSNQCLTWFYSILGIPSLTELKIFTLLPWSTTHFRQGTVSGQGKARNSRRHL